MDPAERHSFARANRDLLTRTVARLDGLITQLSGEQRANGRRSC
jgi:hypothetical protein